MTTTVLIGTQGNKNVKVKTPNGDMILKPGHWLTLGIHGAALELRSQRMGLIASNIANADTPGFQARDFNFREALGNATREINSPGSSSSAGGVCVRACGGECGEARRALR